MIDIDRIDADLLQAELYRLGARDSALKKRGICSHGWQQRKPDGSVECLYCHKVFASQEAIMADRREVLS
jgi:hypothetical protein